MSERQPASSTQYITPNLTETQLWEIINQSLDDIEDRTLRIVFAYKDLESRYDKGEVGNWIGWQNYISQNCKHGKSRVQTLLRIANDPNPEQALEAHREYVRTKAAEYHQTKIQEALAQSSTERELEVAVPRPSPLPFQSVLQEVDITKTGYHILALAKDISKSYDKAKDTTPPDVAAAWASLLLEASNILREVSLKITRDKNTGPFLHTVKSGE